MANSPMAIFFKEKCEGLEAAVEKLKAQLAQAKKANDELSAENKDLLRRKHNLIGEIALTKVQLTEAEKVIELSLAEKYSCSNTAYELLNKTRKRAREYQRKYKGEE